MDNKNSTSVSMDEGGSTMVENKEEVTVEGSAEVESFLKRLFNWKYLAFIILFAVIFAFDISTTGKNGLRPGVFGYITIAALILSVKYKASKLKSIGMFFASMILYLFLTGLTSIVVLANFPSNKMMVQQAVASINEKTPYEDTYGHIVIGAKAANGLIVLQTKLPHNTKQSISSNFIETVEQFEKASSCKDKSIQAFLNKNIGFKMEYFDMNGLRIGAFNITKKECE